MKRLLAIWALILVTGVSVSGEKITFVSSPIWSKFTDIAVDSNYAYCTFSAGLMILDISNPADIKPVSQLPLAGITNGIALIKGYAYLANSEEGFLTIDISNSLEPKVVDKYKMIRIPSKIDISGKYAIVRELYRGILILDITDPEKPKRCTRLFTRGYIDAALIKDQYLYLNGNEDGSSIFDISDPNDIKLISKVGFDDNSSSTMLNGYISVLTQMCCGEEEKYMIDITDPRSPKRLYSYPGINPFSGYVYIGDTLYQGRPGWRSRYYRLLRY
jgi:hypothetical protein